MAGLETTNWHILRETLNRGFELLERGDVRQAAECCRRALKIKPDLVEAHFLVGLVALEGKDRRTAFSAFGSVTKLQPGHAAAWAHLARLYMSEGQVNRADAALLKATSCASDDPMVHDLLGTVASLMGDYDDARWRFERAVGKAPNHIPFLLNLGNNLVFHGDTGAAQQIFEKIIAIRPDSPQAHWALSAARKAEDSRHIEQMRALVSRDGADPRGLAFYFYGLGKELEDLDRWEEAFEAFAEGAAKRRTTVEYDEAAEIAMFDFLRESFTEKWFDRAAGGNLSSAPIFVLGQPRTGTTLLERIITSHSEVHSAGELQQFGLAIRRLSNFQDAKRFSSGLFEAAMQLDPGKIGDLYLDTTRKMQGGTRHFVDKLPQNYLFLPLILKALPNAKIVHVTRDPRDAAFASFKQLFADAYLHSYDLGETARHHARYWHLMNEWRRRFGHRFIDVAYEDIVSDVEASARRVIDFLGLSWERACLEFHRQSTAVSTASAAQVREPVHTRSIRRWRRYDRQLEPMISSLRTAGVTLPD
jgi:Tfp pilus assembly protein PilF